MQNLAIKVLLNNSICSSLPVQQEKTFSRVPADNIQPPDYRSQFFETLPTMWAAAYIFQRAIEREDRATIEEWASLLLLHSFNTLHIETVKQAALQQEYDRDLWPAMNGTYPAHDNPLRDLKLLRTANGTIVGACYPKIILFPGRGRSGWHKDENLHPYLEEDGEHISWTRCSEELLREPKERQLFQRRLLSIAEKLELEVRTALLDFCKRESVFKGIQQNDPLELLSDNPGEWPKLVSHHNGDQGDEETPEERIRRSLLSNYPYKQERNGVITYYFLTGMPVISDWMKKPFKVGFPAPNQYERFSEDAIKVKADQEYIFKRRQNEDFRLLSELFLNQAQPYYCKLDKNIADKHAGQIRLLHRLEISNNTRSFSEVLPHQYAICLAPIAGEFFEHFQPILKEPDKYIAITGRTETGGLKWEFTLFGQKIIWPTEPICSGSLPGSKLSIWPPKVSPQWHLYVAHGTGLGNRWHLVDEEGGRGQMASLSDDEYISILNQTGRPNRPMALIVSDTNGKDRGALFLTSLDTQPDASKDASLAMDFGTSNSSLAFTVPGEEPMPLKFSLSPRVIWGIQPQLGPSRDPNLPLHLENPGFVPFDWGGRKGYFPTILLKRQAKDTDFEGIKASNFEIRHLFLIDIPGLHADMEARVFDEKLKNAWPEIHKNLKWDHLNEYPWRRPAFLGLVMLYAHAELFFRREARVKKEDYVFTYPLAFSDDMKISFEKEVTEVVRRIRNFCFGDGGAIKPLLVDESRAIANSVGAEGGGSLLEVFIDIGGGTTDIAIRHDERYLLKDSVKVAGNSFFTFAKQNFQPNAANRVNGSENFKEHIGRILLENSSLKAPSADFVDQTVAAVRDRIDLGTFYSLCINRLDDEDFRSKEAAILSLRMGRDSYQRYRSRLFFDHVVAYALLQACALVAEKKLSLAVGLKLILSGNGWGLMVFGELTRKGSDFKSRCQQILEDLIDAIERGYEIIDKAESEKETESGELDCLKRLKIASVVLLNQTNLSEAKTAVAAGALSKIADEDARKEENENTKPYIGLTFPGVSINGSNKVSFRWCQRWEANSLKSQAKIRQDFRSLQIDEQGNPEEPLDHILKAFISLGELDEAFLPSEEWLNINNRLRKGKAKLPEDSYLDGDRLGVAPINFFLSQLLYPKEEKDLFLNKLAEISGTLK